LAEATTKLDGLTARLNDVDESFEAGTQQLARLQAGDFGTPRAHIRHAHTPLPPIPNSPRLVRLWAAISGGLILLTLLGLTYLRPAGWPLWLLGSAVVMGAIDALARGRLTTFLLRVTLLLAIFTTIILLYNFWLLLLVLGVALVVGITIRDNLREVWR
jgi:hypothetical protein